MRRLVVSLFLFAGVVALIFASGTGESTQAAGEPSAASQLLKAAMTTNPQSLDEGYSSTTATRQVSSYIYETLFTIGEDYGIIPQLADSYSVSSDNLVYTIKLRSGISFHNGQPLTADDAKASLERFMTTPLAGDRFKAVKSIEVVDSATLRISLSSDINLLTQLALPSRPVIMPKSIAEQHMKNEITPADVIGTGPYKLLNWTPDVAVKLVRFDGYVQDKRYDKPSGLGGLRTANFKEIDLLPVPEAAGRIAGLQTGEFDYAESIPVTSYGTLKQTAGITPIIIKPRWSIMVELNKSEFPTNNVSFRRALIYALDMKKVMEAVTAGNSDFYRTEPSLFTPEQAYYSEAGSAGVYNNPDPAKVKQLLEAANYQGQPVTYLVNKDFDWMYKACLSLAQQWQAAGINVQLEFHDWPSQIKKAQSLKNWQINQSGWSPRLDPSQVDSAFGSTSIGSYGYNNPQMDSLLTQLRRGLPFDQRKQVWDRIQKLVWDDVPVIKVGDYFELEGVRSNVQNYHPFYVIPRFWNVTKS